jgi:cold shock CspA family protein
MNGEKTATRRDGNGGLRIVGTIKRVIEARGFCFIRDQQGTEYFCHLSAMEPGEFAKCKVGDDVEFEPTTAEQGPRAEHVVRL